MQGGVDDFAEVVRRDVGRHSNSNTLRAIHEEVWELGWKYDRLFVGVVVVRNEINGLFVDTRHELES